MWTVRPLNSHFLTLSTNQACQSSCVMGIAVQESFKYECSLWSFTCRGICLTQARQLQPCQIRDEQNVPRARQVADIIHASNHCPKALWCGLIYNRLTNANPVNLDPSIRSTMCNNQSTKMLRDEDPSGQVVPGSEILTETTYVVFSASFHCHCLSFQKHFSRD